MKITLLIFTLFSQLSVFAKEQFVNDSLKVLFVGNSLTYYNAMPQLLQQMLNEGEEKVKVEQSTFPGMQLRHHLVTLKSNYPIGMQEDPNNLNLTKEKLRNSNWEYVILQEGTVSFLIPGYVQNSLQSTFSNILAEFVNPKTKFVLFETWAMSKHFPKNYCIPIPNLDSAFQMTEYCSPKIENKEEEISLIATSCREIAKSNKMILSKNGELYYQFELRYPEYPLYDVDSHPTLEGAFLNACIFYELISQKESNKLQFNGDLDPKTASIIKQFVSKTKL